MLHEIWSYVDWALGLGLEAKDLGAGQMSLRAFVVFIVAIGIIRFGDERFMGKSTALDVMLGIVFGSVVSRAITGNAPFFPTLAASVVLVAMHWVISAITFRSRRFGRVVKGPTHLLVSDGEIDWNEMRKTHISRNDLREAMRQHGHVDDLNGIESAYLERNGSISIIFRGQGNQAGAASNRPPDQD
jgi:uncharacterized membrane protein YcaP (DUF421 family)